MLVKIPPTGQKSQKDPIDQTNEGTGTQNKSNWSNLIGQLALEPTEAKTFIKINSASVTQPSSTI